MGKKLIVLICLAGCSLLHSQHTISGTFSPAKDYSWLIAYHLRPGAQSYFADTAINNGRFSINMPQNSPVGTYRLVYGVPQEEFYLDVIYNGKEDIKLAFDLTRGVTFTTSQENILFGTYFIEINALEQQIMDFYTNEKSDKTTLRQLFEKTEKTQLHYEKITGGLLVNTFVKANSPYIPSDYQKAQAYISGKKEHYFNALDLTDPQLQASGFLTDKLINYVFTALPPCQMSSSEIEKAIQENVTSVNTRLQNASDPYKLNVFNNLWTQAAGNHLKGTSDFIYENYLKPLLKATDNQKAMGEIETHNRLRLGNSAPEIAWKDGALSTMDNADCYIIVFWSSTCPHCLKELPALQKELKNHPAIKVIAVGLEDDEATWKKESMKIPGFEHVIALGRWENEYAKLYDVHKTPTYYILDADKRIIAKPESDREVVEFLEK